MLAVGDRIEIVRIYGASDITPALRWLGGNGEHILERSPQ